MKGSGEEKQRLRAHLLTLRMQQDAQQNALLSTQAQEILLAQDVWHRATTVALYMPVRGEMQTQLLLQHAWSNKKMVLLPRCRKNMPGYMDFFVCAGYDDVTAGSYGILEPAPHCTRMTETMDLELIVVPGVGFDIHGYRIGFGGGYYDRMLASQLCVTTTRVGLAFASQIVDAVPKDAWDFPMHAVVTEEGMLWM